MEEFEEIGQLAYEGYVQAKGAWEAPWEELPEREQENWRECARNVMRKGWIESQRPPRRKHA